MCHSNNLRVPPNTKNTIPHPGRGFKPGNIKKKDRTQLPRKKIMETDKKCQKPVKKKQKTDYLETRASTLRMIALFRTIRFSFITRSGSNRLASRHLKKIEKTKYRGSICYFRGLRPRERFAKFLQPS